MHIIRTPLSPQPSAVAICDVMSVFPHFVRFSPATALFSPLQKLPLGMFVLNSRPITMGVVFRGHAVVAAYFTRNYPPPPSVAPAQVMAGMITSSASHFQVPPLHAVKGMTLLCNQALSPIHTGPLCSTQGGPFYRAETPRHSRFVSWLQRGGLPSLISPICSNFDITSQRRRG